MKKTLISTILVITSLIVILVTMTFSWFTNYRIVDIETIDLSVMETKEVKASIDGINYGFDVVDDTPINLRPLAGIGEVMYEPIMGRKEIYTEDKTYSGYQNVPVGYTDLGNIDNIEGIYVSKIYVDSTASGQFNLLLSSLDVDIEEPTNESDESAYGLDLNYLKAAIRVAILVENEDSYKTKFIWIPYPKYELELTDGVYSINENGEIEDYIFVDGTDVTSTFTIDTSKGSNYVDPNHKINFYFGDCTSGIANLCNITDTACLKIVLWLDGNDRECHPAFQGASDGTFNCNIGLKMSFRIAF